MRIGILENILIYSRKLEKHNLYLSLLEYTTDQFITVKEKKI